MASREVNGAVKRQNGAPTPGVRRPVRVLYVESNEDHTVGGSHQGMFDLARSLPRDRYEPVVLFHQDNVYVERLRALGIQVIVFDAERARERDIYANRGILGRRLGQLAAIGRRRQLLRRERIGLLHLNNSPNIGTDDWLPAALLARIPAVVFAMGPARHEPQLMRHLLMGRFDHVIAISDYVARSVRDVGIPESRVSLVYLGVDIPRLRSQVQRSRGDVRASLGVGDEVLVAMVGNVRPWKGQHVVVAALAELPPEVRRLMRVVFVGAVAPADQPYMDALRVMVAQHGLEPIVSFVGSRSDVPDLLNAADVAVHASIVPEPFGLVVPEAMVFGKGVIAANTGGPKEVITPESGLLFDPQSPSELAACLREMVLNPERRAALGRGALQRVESFSIERNVEGVIDVYDRVISGT